MGQDHRRAWQVRDTKTGGIRVLLGTGGGHNAAALPRTGGKMGMALRHVQGRVCLLILGRVRPQGPLGSHTHTRNGRSQVRMQTVPSIGGFALDDAAHLQEYLQQLSAIKGSVGTIPKAIFRLLQSKACRGTRLTADVLQFKQKRQLIITVEIATQGPSCLAIL